MYSKIVLNSYKRELREIKDMKERIDKFSDIKIQKRNKMLSFSTSRGKKEFKAYHSYLIPELR